ncbi:MAG: hypothetical protein ACI976_001828 [Aureispira sp.]|jgi:hypothetical protein
MDEFFFFILIITGVPMGLYFLGSFFKIKLEIFRKEQHLEDPKTKTEATQGQIEYLMSENEEMKEELRNIKYLLSRETNRERIDFDYEKEQIKLDHDAKGSLSL